MSAELWGPAPRMVRIAAWIGSAIAAVLAAGAATQALPSWRDAAIGAELALTTLASEDLTCVGAGALVANGTISYALAAAACFAGIFLGDLALFAAGRIFGRRLLGMRLVRRFVSEADVARSADWLEQRGSRVIVMSRFLPGTRLPTYVAAGMLGTNVWRFVGSFAVAAALWTPALVWLSARFGAGALESALAASAGAGTAVVTAGLAALVLVRATVALANPRSRRLLGARVRRVARWEFWPPWMFYPPVLVWIAWLAIRHRGLTVFTAANPAIPDGGFVGESKSAILASLTGDPARVARTTLIRGSLRTADRVAAARSFMSAYGLGFPIVCKPDVGQRGEGVEIVRDADHLERTLQERHGDTVVQAYAPGSEFGIFWVRRPGEARGRITSVTEKRFPSVIGDGRRTVDELIVADDRAVLMRGAYARSLGGSVRCVPDAGERVPLVEIGSHCRGAVFLDGGWVRTDALERAFDRVADGFDGFHFGRYDVRVESIDAFQRGEGFTVVELNGVTAESTHIYDPRTRLVDAYRAVFAQWRTAFEIGAANRDRGARPTPAGRLAAAALGFVAPGVARRFRISDTNGGEVRCNA